MGPKKLATETIKDWRAYGLLNDSEVTAYTCRIQLKKTNDEINPIVKEVQQLVLKRIDTGERVSPEQTRRIVS